MSSRPIFVALRAQRRRVTLVLIWLFASALCFYLDKSPILRSVEQVTLRQRFLALSQYDAPLREWARQQIVLVPMSDETFDPQGGGLQGPPVSRKLQAKVVRELTRAGAAAIVFDMVFDTSKPAEDGQFAAAVRDSKRVVWGSLYAPSLVQPHANLRDTGALTGDIEQHIKRGRVDTMSLFNRSDKTDDPTPALSFQAASLLAGTRDPTRMPTDENGEFRVTFWTNQNGADANSAGSFFPTVPYEDVLEGVADDPFYGQGFFQNKVVIIGDATTLSNDFRNTPTTEMMVGMEIQAHATATVLAALVKGVPPIRDSPAWLNVLLIALGAALACRVVATWRWTIAVPALFVLEIALFAFNLWLFVVLRQNAHFVAPLVALALAALLTFGERALTDEREKLRVRAQWQRHVDPQVAQFILKHPDRLAMGELSTATVLFADIRGFTRLSTELEPRQTLALLNEYLSAMTEVVQRNGGTLDKYVGDAVMAVFGLPMPYDDHAARAVRSALEMQAVFAELRARWLRPDENGKVLPDFDLGIGINTGEMLCGELGAHSGDSQRTDFTVIGDAVNVAAHIEAQTKEFKTRLLIGESTWQATREQIEARGPLTAHIKHGRTVLVYDDVQLRTIEKANAPEAAPLVFHQETKIA